MYCSKCGATLRQGSNFCQNCGQQVVQSPIVEKRLTDPPVLTGVKDTSTTKNSSLVGCLVLVIVVIIGFVILRGCSGTSSQSTRLAPQSESRQVVLQMRLARMYCWNLQAVR